MILYQAFAPDGAIIIATIDKIVVTSGIASFNKPSPDSIDWTGESEIHFEDENGNEWKASELRFEEEVNSDA